MVTREDLLQGRAEKYKRDLTPQILMNLDRLAKVLTDIEEAYGQPLTINSGWRPPEVNASIPGSAKQSKHMVGLAVDISDVSGEFFKWCLNNLPLMKQLACYFEDFRYTPTWTHIQLVAPMSGHRVFKPNNNPPAAPSRWGGQYDKIYDL